MSVFFGDKYASNIIVDSSTHILADVSDGTPFGNTKIKLGENLLSGFIISGSTINLLPTIDNILDLNQSIGNDVTIYGDNLDGDITVTFSGVEATVLSNNSTSCSVFINSGTTFGENTVIVINKYGSSNRFEYIIPNNIYDPIITSFEPNRDYKGSPINLYGSNFIVGTGNAVYYGNMLAEKISGHTTEKIKTETSLLTPTGFIDIKIINANGSYIKSGFEMLPLGTPPIINNVVPTFAKEGDVIDVYGSNLIDGGISFGTLYPGISGVTDTISDTHLQTTLPKIIDTSGSNKLINIYVSNLSGTSIYSPFEVYTLPITSPNIQTLSPLSGDVGTLITITGSFFSKYYTEASVYINGIYYMLDSQEYISDSEIRGKIPDVSGYTGSVFIHIKTSAGSNQKGGFNII